MKTNHVGRRLTTLRMERGQTRLEQAADLKVHPRTLARWVNGRHLPDPTSPTGVRLSAYLRKKGR